MVLNVVSFYVPLLCENFFRNNFIRSDLYMYNESVNKWIKRFNYNAMFLQQISRFIYFFLIIFLSQLSGLQCNEYRMHLLVHITLIVIVRSCITFCLLTLWCVCVLNIRVVLLHFEVAFRINYISLITLCCYCIVAQKQVFFCVLRDMVL